MSQQTLLQPESVSLLQSYGDLAPMRIALPEDVRHQSVMALNRLLAHTIATRDLYKRSHWQTSGSSFYELHLLFDKHYVAQELLMDAIAERIQMLGGVARNLARDVFEESRLARGPAGIETAIDQLQRLVDVHEFVLVEARPLAREATTRGDDGTNDLIVGKVICSHEAQSWAVQRHLVVQRRSGR